MAARAVALILGIGVLAFVGFFTWSALRTPGAREAAGGTPTAEVSEQLSDGRIEVKVFALGDRDVRVEVGFTPNADAVEADGMLPEVNFAMVDMHMDGIAPTLELVEAGVWRARLKLPMAGRWVVNVGFAEDFTEVEFDA